ncbi:MAG: hypothetical protein JWO08_2700 [Verrucomicrobiaceae bacterium]|nr:hypothetical protein [Verrucomicrobiaceae bacterium]
MIHWWFLFRLNTKLLMAAIAEAESRTSGEIRIFVSHKKCPLPMDAATEQFQKLGMTKTKERNGVLLFIAPRSRNFAIVGDLGIHEKCSEAFWQELAATMSQAFREGRLTQGLIQTVQRAGTLLAEHFPCQNDDRNELPNEIVRG